MTAIVITATGVLLVQTDLTASKAGFLLNFALMVSGGGSTESLTNVGLFSLLERAAAAEQTFVSAERLNSCRSRMGWADCRYRDGGTRATRRCSARLFVAVKRSYTDSGSSRAIRSRSAGSPARGLRGHTRKPALGHADSQAGQRVGLVGTTGSGKSTLALSLFRGHLQTGGSIEIDGVGEQSPQAQLDQQTYLRLLCLSYGAGLIWSSRTVISARAV
jgi:ABC-type multidrug transport system fused ATPase/permease subunit